MNSPVVLYSLVILMVICWSGNYVAAKFVFREIPPALVMLLRTIVSGLLMIPVFWHRRSRFVRGESGLLFMLGVFGITLNQLFWTLGAARTTVVHSSMIMATTPVWVLVIAAMLGIERITMPKIGGMAMAVAGIAILQIFRTTSAAVSPTIVGDLLMLCCSLTFAVMTAYGKRYKPQSGGIAVNAFAYIAGALLCAPLYWVSGPTFDFARVTPGAWIGVFYMGAFSSVTGYLIYYYALERISASRIAAFQYLQPVFASGMALAILGEQITLPTIAAGGVIVAGVVVTERFG